MKISPMPPSPGESSNSPNTINTPPKAGIRLNNMLFTIFMCRFLKRKGFRCTSITLLHLYRLPLLKKGAAVMR
jgi:hypothetical protein